MTYANKNLKKPTFLFEIHFEKTVYYSLHFLFFFSIKRDLNRFYLFDIVNKVYICKLLQKVYELRDENSIFFCSKIQ